MTTNNSREREEFLKTCGDVYDAVQKAKPEKCTCWHEPERPCKYCHYMEKAETKWAKLAEQYSINQ